MSRDLDPTGLQIRKEMFGAEWVERRNAAVTDFTRPFVEMINDFAFAQVWSRPGLDRKTRSMLTLAMLVALNRPHEMTLHVRAALNNGVSKDEIRETLLHATLYCGFPAAFDAFRVCSETFTELGLE